MQVCDFVEDFSFFLVFYICCLINPGLSFCRGPVYPPGNFHSQLGITWSKIISIHPRKYHCRPLPCYTIFLLGPKIQYSKIQHPKITKFQNPTFQNPKIQNSKIQNPKWRGVGATTTTKWQTSCFSKQPPLQNVKPGGTNNHRHIYIDLLNLSKQLLSMLHPSLRFFIYLYVTSGYFWWILVVWGWHLGAKWLGCCMVVAFPGTTKWQPYKFLKQPPLQNGNPGPSFQLTTLQKPQEHHRQTKAACTHPRGTLKVLDNPAVVKGFSSCHLA